MTAEILIQVLIFFSATLCHLQHMLFSSVPVVFGQGFFVSRNFVWKIPLHKNVKKEGYTIPCLWKVDVVDDRERRAEQYKHSTQTSSARGKNGEQIA